MNFKPMYEVEVSHDGLGKYRHIKGSDYYVVQQKAAAQVRQWVEMWQRRQEADRRKQEAEELAAERLQAAIDKSMWRDEVARNKIKTKEDLQRHKESRRREAEAIDLSAKEALDALRNILAHTLTVNDAIDWDALKDESEFTEPEPRLELPPGPSPKPAPAMPVPSQHPPEPHYAPPPEVNLAPLPPKPEPGEQKYQPVADLLDKVMPGRRDGKIRAARERYEDDLSAWEQVRQRRSVKLKLLREEMDNVQAKNAASKTAWQQTIERIEATDKRALSEWESADALAREKNERAMEKWRQACTAVKASHPKAIDDWEDRKAAHYARRDETNAAIDRSRDSYLSGHPGAVADYCEMVLSNSQYPDFFPKEWDLDYVADTRTLVLEYAMPAPDSLPALKEVQYVATKDAFKETRITDKERDALYDDLLYQIALRTVHELFEADVANALDAVVFNGLVTTLDRASGHDTTACIISFQARKDEFMAINLANVEPRSCFRTLKGVAAAKLSGLAPVPPVLMIDKADRRFVDSYAVADSLHAGVNLAAMDWEDFEHLIREVFGKEFATSGGEVKVTQASRDGGVDAVAFDPDPIRGGKIVIQAKRYANTVGVSAVRDLYGTVLNEGATKGILVTTAHYGPDAYDFAKGKPLTLLNGSNLLHLLEKHGHQARIDLQEAKLMAKNT